MQRHAMPCHGTAWHSVAQHGAHGTACQCHAMQLPCACRACCRSRHAAMPFHAIPTIKPQHAALLCFRLQGCSHPDMCAMRLQCCSPAGRGSHPGSQRHGTSQGQPGGAWLAAQVGGAGGICDCSRACMRCVAPQQLGAHGMWCGAPGCFAMPVAGMEHRRQTTSNTGEASRAQGCLAAPCAVRARCARWTRQRTVCPRPWCKTCFRRNEGAWSGTQYPASSGGPFLQWLVFQCAMQPC